MQITTQKWKNETEAYLEPIQATMIERFYENSLSGF